MLVCFLTCRTETACLLCCRQLQEAVVAHTEAAAATTRMLTAERDAAIAARDKALADAAAKDAAVATANTARSAAEAEATQLRNRPAAPVQGVLSPGTYVSLCEGPDRLEIAAFLWL